MKKTKKGQAAKTVKLNKQTIANLSKVEQQGIKAGAYAPCWENLWTLYYCGVMYTGIPDTRR